MPKLPVVSSRQAIAAFTRCGWAIARRKGSHTTLTKPGSKVILTIPRKKEMPRGTLRCQIRAAGLTVEEFVAAMGK